MDNPSFIPKRVLTKAEDRPRYRPVSLLSVIGVAVLVVSLAAWGVVWSYERLLDNQINRPCQSVTSGGDTKFQSCGLLASVDLEEKNLDRGTIVLLQRLDSKFKIAQELINQHTTIIPLFKTLEDLTLPSVSYGRFAFTTTGVEISGLASSYEDIAVQSQIFAANRDRITSFIFSDLDLDGTGHVIFKLNLALDPDLTGYLKQTKT